MAVSNKSIKQQQSTGVSSQAAGELNTPRTHTHTHTHTHTYAHTAGEHRPIRAGPQPADSQNQMLKKFLFKQKSVLTHMYERETHNWKMYQSTFVGKIMK